jgi:hypothetical protein
MNFTNLFGGAKEDRTPDLLNAIQALSQLSYSPISYCHSRAGGNPSFAPKLLGLEAKSLRISKLLNFMHYFKPKGYIVNFLFEV